MPHSARLNRPRRRPVLLPTALTSSLKFIVIALVVAGLYFGRDILVPLAMAALLGFVLDPLVSRLCRLGLRRGASVVLVSVTTLTLAAGVTVVVALQMVQLGHDLPRYQATIEAKLRGLREQVLHAGSLDSASRLIVSVERELEATRRALNPPGATPAPRPAAPIRVIESTSPLDELTRWLAPLLDRLLTGGIAVALLVFILLERHELCDRILRLAGPNLRPMTEALNEAARRVSAYLTMQVLVNLGFGAALGLGLWLLDIPGALLWGTLAALLRFVPYLGPALAAAFPLGLAFAIDPGWELLAWTAALILVLELILNNVVEPWLYGASAGLATVAILLSAAFWTALWGPVGLILATPLSVCLVVLGRHLPPFRFLDVLFGSDPVFDTRTRLYRRLGGGHTAEAILIAHKEVADHGLAAFYARCAIPALGEVAGDRAALWADEYRDCLHAGMAEVIESLGRDSVPDAPTPHRTPVRCVPLSGPADALSAAMLSQALGAAGRAARLTSVEALTTAWPPAPDPAGPPCVVLVSFHPAPQRSARQIARRLRRLAPGTEIHAGFWRGENDPLPDTTALQADLGSVFHDLETGLSRLVPAGAAPGAASGAVSEPAAVSRPARKPAPVASRPGAIDADTDLPPAGVLP